VWNNFAIKLEYKSKWSGKTIFVIGKFDSSSKICHFCGYRNSELTLKYREWKCPDRKTKHDSGINSVINIKKLSIIDQNLIGI
jgi:putative transposase